MNLISKQISELRAYAKDRKGELAKLVNDAADTIETLSTKLSAANLERSSRYYNGGWIPFKTRALTDEEKEDVLATCGYRGVEDTSIRWIRTLYFDGDCWCCPTGGTYDQKVYAWMPLPEPWRGDSICK